MTESATKKVVAIALLLVGSAVIVVQANLWKGDLKVTKVRVDGNQIVTEKEILSLAKIDSDSKLFAVDLFAVQQCILENTFIRSAKVGRDVQGGIVITVLERIPLAGIVMDKLFYLDQDGFVLPPARSESIFDLPILTGTFARNSLVPGKQVPDATVREGLAILRTAQLLDEELYRRISEVHIEGGKDIVFYTAESGVPVIFGHGDIGVKLVKFESFWKKFVLHHGAQELQYIDLRFEDQVVVRWNHDKSEIPTTSAHLNILTKEHSWTTLL